MCCHVVLNTSGACCQRSASAQVFQATHWCFRSREKDDETLSAPMRRILVLLWNKFKIFKMFPPQELILCAGFRSAAESSHPVSMLASVNHQWTVGVMWCHQLCRCLHLASSWRERERGFSLHDEHRDSHWSWSVYWTHVRNFYTKRLFLWSRVFTWVTSCWEDQETQTWFIITSVSLNIRTVWHVHHQ